MTKNKKLVWVTNVDTALKAFRLARMRGEDTPEGREKAFLEFAQRDNNTKCLGNTKLDIDDLQIHLEAEGKSVININEINKNNK